MRANSLGFRFFALIGRVDRWSHRTGFRGVGEGFGTAGITAARETA
jgi:hypothetical protein